MIRSNISGLLCSLIFMRSFIAIMMLFVRSSMPCFELFSAAPAKHSHSSTSLINVINNMEGKSYEERLYCLKLCPLEERRNKQDVYFQRLWSYDLMALYKSAYYYYYYYYLIEVFKMCNGLSRLKLNEFFTLADNTKGIRGHSRKLLKFRCMRDCCNYFFQTEWLIDRINQLDLRVVDA